MPVALLFLINEELQPVDRLALLLTCRSLFHVFPSIESIPLNEPERTDFLVHLERDLNDRYALCTSCGVLRRFTKTRHLTASTVDLFAKLDLSSQ
jgi:hypothetical protein